MENKVNSIIIFWNNMVYNDSCQENVFFEIPSITKIINVIDDDSKQYVNTTATNFLYKELIYRLPFERYVSLELRDKFKPYEMNILKVINRNFLGSGKPTSLNNMIIYYEKSLSYINHLFKSEKVQMCIFFDTPHHPIDYLTFLYCKIYKISNYTTKKLPSNHSGELPSRRFITKNFPYLDSVFDQHYINFIKDLPNSQLLSADMHEYIEEYSNYSAVLYNTKHLGDRWNLKYIFLYLMRRFIYQLTRLRLIDIFIKSKTYIYRLTIDRYIRYNILNYYSKMSTTPSLDEKYIYFPLQYQPEATTIPLGNEFSNQELAINYILENTPEHIFLYLKEHPAYWYKISNTDKIRESRSLDFYKRLASNNRILFVSKDFHHLKLISNSIAVVTITGTVAFESFGLNKTVFVFGQYIYSNMANAIKLPSSKGAKILNKISDNNVDYSNEFLATLYALEKVSFKVNLNSDNDDSVKSLIRNELEFIKNYILDK